MLVNWLIDQRMNSWSSYSNKLNSNVLPTLHSLYCTSQCIISAQAPPGPLSWESCTPLSAWSLLFTIYCDQSINEIRLCVPLNQASQGDKYTESQIIKCMDAGKVTDYEEISIILSNTHFRWSIMFIWSSGHLHQVLMLLFWTTNVPVCFLESLHARSRCLNLAKYVDKQRQPHFLGISPGLFWGTNRARHFWLKRAPNN